MDPVKNRMEKNGKRRGPFVFPRVLPYQTMRCPNCGSSRIRTIRTARIENVIQREHHCKHCGIGMRSAENVAAVDRDVPSNGDSAEIPETPETPEPTAAEKES